MASAQGRTVGLDVRGRGENLQLALLGTDFTLKEYNLGTAASSASPAQTRDYSSVIVRDNATITYDNEGGMWINQNDPNGEKPTILHLSAEGVDYDNVTAGLPHTMGVKMSGIAVNPNGTELAVVSPSKIIVYTISKDSEGKISLTTKYSLSTSRDNTALSYDYAGNLYAGNRYSERINFYAMPYDGEVTTPAPSKYAFELTEVVPEVYTVTVNKVGEGTIEGGGEYLENSTVTLKATPAEHYEFTGWTVENDEVPAEVGKDGMKAHYYCAECDKYFDANKNEVSRESLIIPALPGVDVPELDDVVVTPGDGIYGGAVRTEDGVKYLIVDVHARYGLTIAQLKEMFPVVTNGVSVIKTTSVTDINGQAVTAGDDSLVATGYTVTFTATGDSGSATATYILVLLGDINCDGKTTSSDAVMNKRHVMNKSAYATRAQALAADVNCDSIFTSSDSVAIKRKVLNGANAESPYISKIPTLAN